MDIFCCEFYLRDSSKIVSMGGGLGFLPIFEKSFFISMRVYLSERSLLLINWMELRRDVGDCIFIQTVNLIIKTLFSRIGKKIFKTQAKILL